MDTGRTGYRERPRRASFVLEAIGELGLPGLILSVCLLVALVGVAARARFRLSSDSDRDLAAGLTAVPVVWVVAADVDWMWESTAFAVLVLFGALQLPAMMSASAQRDSKEDAAAGRLVPALDDARRAERWSPWSAEAALQRSLVEKELRRFAAARRTQETAAGREPTNWRIPYSLFALEGEEGRPGPAFAALQRTLNSIRTLGLPDRPALRRLP